MLVATDLLLLVTGLLPLAFSHLPLTSVLLILTFYRSASAHDSSQISHSSATIRLLFLRFHQGLCFPFFLQCLEVQNVQTGQSFTRPFLTVFALQTGETGEGVGFLVTFSSFSCRNGSLRHDVSLNQEPPLTPPPAPPQILLPWRWFPTSSS